MAATWATSKRQGARHQAMAFEDTRNYRASSENAIRQLDFNPTRSVDDGIEEIKTLAVDKKWMATMESHIKAEMDAISYRLTNRITELAERYENSMPKLTNKVRELTAKVENHLKQMDYVW